MKEAKTTSEYKLKRQKKHIEKILIYLYRFHFLNRPQLQKLLNQKSKTNIIAWLNYLTENKYLRSEYVKRLNEEPTIYSLNVMARKYFISFPEIEDINIPLLDRVWKEKGYSAVFKKQCMLLGDVYISLKQLIKTIESGKGKLNFFTKVDLTGVKYMIDKAPDAYFTITDKNGKAQGYFLEIIREHAPRKRWEARIRRIINYFNSEMWQRHMRQDFPEIIFACPNYYYKKNIDEYIKEELSNTYTEINFYLTTSEEIKRHGMNSKILHKVEIE